MAVPRAPPKVVQQRMFQTALFGPVPPGDFWEYAIAEDWLAQYKESIFDKNTQEVNICPLYVSPDGDANTFIGESRWKILITWFGIAEDSTLLRRPSFAQQIPVNLPSGQDLILPNKNMDFLKVSVGRLEHLQNPKYYHCVQIYFWEQFAFLEFMARHLLKIAPSSNVRLWMSVTAGGQDKFFKCIDQSVLSWFGCLGNLICAEEEAVLYEMRTRQAIFLNGMPPDACLQTLPASSNEHIPHLDEVFERLGLVITFSIEEISPKMTNLGTSAVAQQENGILGDVAQFVNSSVKGQSDWDEALNGELQQLSVGVNEVVEKTTSVIYDQTKRIVGDKMAAVEEKQTEAEEKLKQLCSKESELNTKEKELDEREHDLENKIAKFKQNLTDFLTQKKKFEDELKRIESQNKISESRIELNIGGVHFTTSTTTLMQDADSLLASMFNGRNTVHRETDGSYFIDQDGTHFRYILNYLREGTKAADSFPGNPSFVKELLIEAKYYNMKSLITALEEKLK